MKFHRHNTSRRLRKNDIGVSDSTSSAEVLRQKFPSNYLVAQRVPKELHNAHRGAAAADLMVRLAQIVLATDWRLAKRQLRGDHLRKYNFAVGTNDLLRCSPSTVEAATAGGV